MTVYSPYDRPPPRPLAVLPLVLAGAALTLTLFLLWERVFPPQLHDDAEPRVITPRGELAPFEKTIIDVYEANRASVVHITSPEVIVRTPYYGYARLEAGTGTGFVWDDRGYVVTNYHVVQGRDETNILVRLANQKEYAARLVGYRADLDIAVILILGLNTELRPVPIGTSADLLVGQTVLAIGNPFGLDHTLTTGVISALDRTIESVVQTEITGTIQVDAAINPGNSGGPLLDSAGRLIGMNTAIKSPTGASAGIGFAVPVDTINSVVPRLIRGAPPVTERALLGISASLIRFRGQLIVMVSSVSPGSGAAAAGLRGERRVGGQRILGDVITAIEGTPVRHPQDIPALIEDRSPGDRVQVDVIRGLPDRAERVILEVELKLARDFR